MPRRKQKAGQTPDAKWTWMWSDEASSGEAFDSYDEALDDAESYLEGNDSEDEAFIVVYMMVPKAKLTRASVKVEKL